MKRLDAYLDRRLITLITFTALGLFVGMFVIYGSQNANLFYGDGKSRLLIARRVFDSLTPGFTQLGAIWPPLPQILFLPTIWNNYFFYSGLSGSLVSISSATIATYFLAKMILGVSKNKFATTVAAIAFVLNPSFLYMTTTPMTETLFISLSIISTHLIWKWSKKGDIVYLPIAGAAVLAASLTRYDGWFFAGFSALIIPVIVFLKRKSFSEIRGTFILFSTVAFSGIFLWLIYNKVIYGNTLHFATGEGSTLAYSAGSGLVKLMKGNIIKSSLIYLSAAALNIGVVSLSVTLLAFILALFRRSYNFLFAILLLSTPPLFNVVSLCLGNSELSTGQFMTNGLYNTRYGLFVLPVSALAYGAVASTLKRFNFVVLLPLFLQLTVLFSSPPITLIDVTYGFMSSRAIEQQKTVSWVQSHPTTGLTMVSGLENDVLIFDTQLPLKKVIYEGSGKYWQIATDNPGVIAERIIVSPENRDSIWKVSQENKNFFNNYTLVFSGESFRVYDLTKRNRLEVLQPTPTAEPVQHEVTVEKIPVETSCNYTIQVGDSLWRIANNKLGNGRYSTKIVELNNRTYFDLPTVHPGQKLVIPCSVDKPNMADVGS